MLPTTGSLEVKTFNTRNRTVNNSTNIKLWYRENVYDIILSKLSEFSEKESGWAL